MRNGAECGQRAAAWLDADSSVLRQIIIDKYPAAGQYVRLLLQNNTTDASVCRPPLRDRGTKLLCRQSHKQKLLAFQNQIYFIVNTFVFDCTTKRVAETYNLALESQNYKKWRAVELKSCFRKQFR